jgi:hypothetical protein
VSEVEIKQENSIPTAARISLVTLAELTKWWEDSGYRMKTMSQLIAWSMDLLRDTLRANEKIDKESMSLSDAHKFMSGKGLYQMGVRSRSVKKEATALRFDALRSEGVEPKEYVPDQYNRLHNKQSVESSNVKVRTNFDRIKMTRLEEYPDYEYPEGDFATRDRMIAQLKLSGIKSLSEQRAEELERAKMSDLVVKE